MTKKKQADKFELLVEMPLRDMHGNINSVKYWRKKVLNEDKEEAD